MSKLKFQRRHPSSMQLDSAGLISFMNLLDEQELEVHSLLIYKNDAIVLEAAKAPYSLEIPHMSFSQAKGFITTAIGFLYDEKKIDLNNHVIDYFPQYKAQTSLNHMTIKDALMMCTGHETPMFGADFRELEADWLSSFMSIPFNTRAGEQFLYNSGTSYLLSALIERVTGQNVCSYLQPRLFELLGIDKPIWEESPEGINAGGWGLYIKPEHMLKLALLYLNKGKWNEKQLLSESWITEATTLKIKLDDQISSISSRGYGYHIWIGDDDIYRIDGAYGQLCVIDPKANSIVVINGGTLYLEQLRQLVYTELLPKLRENYRTNIANDGENRSSDTQLKQFLKAWTYKHKDYPLQHSINKQAKSCTYEIINSNTDTTKLVLSYTANEGKLVIEDAKGNHSVAFGFGHYVNSETTLKSKLHDHYEWERSFISCIAYWNEQGTLLLTCRYVDKPYVDYFAISFEGSNLFLLRTVNINSIALKQEEISAIESKL